MAPVLKPATALLLSAARLAVLSVPIELSALSWAALMEENCAVVRALSSALSRLLTCAVVRPATCEPVRLRSWVVLRLLS
jgi:hypothetical protein